MKLKTAVLTIVVSLTIFCSLPIMASENLTPAPDDVALLTGLRTDTDKEIEAVIAVRIGSVYLHRQNNDGLVLVTGSFGTGSTEVLTVSELNLCFAPGFDFTVEGRLGSLGGEARYFGVPEWYKSKSVVTSSGGGVVRYLTPLGNVAFPNEISGSYESMLHSAEFSIKWFPMDGLSFLAGPRLLKLDEELKINQNILAPTINHVKHHITSENTLFGGQVGIEGVFFKIGGFSADGWLKAGYYLNRMESTVVVDQENGSDFGSRDDTNVGTFVGDLAVNLNYAITPKFLVTAGYQLLWVEKAALAPIQVPVHDPYNGVGSTADDDVIYQGIRAGVIFLFDVYGKPEPAPEPVPAIEPKIEPMSRN